jgi:hypothetical protein
MATTTAVLEQASRPASRWIISQPVDLLWFTFGGAAAGYLFWALWRFTHVPLLLLVAIWAIVFDETHGFATISRTYFDAEERARRGRWLWGSLVFFFTIGPVLILLGLGDWLELATELWGYYHIFKQHYGFMMLYKAKNKDFDPADNRLDKIFLATAFYYPFLTYPLYDKEARELLPFPIPPRAGELFHNALLFVLILVTLVYLVRQFDKWRRGMPLNWPKQCLLAAAIPINYLLFRSGMPLLGVYAAVTIYHNIQYHRLVWFYNQNKYGKDAGQGRRFGLATFINSRWLAYVGCAALYAFIFDFVPRFVVHPLFGPSDATLRNQIVFSFFAAPGLLHYWIDGHIWKVRSDPTLREYLQLNRP